MALQINPGIGASVGAQEGGSQKPTAPNGTPNQDAANQFADLLKQPAEQEPKKGSSMPTFGSPFQSISRSESKQGTVGQTALGAAQGKDGSTSSDGAPSATPNQDTTKQFTDLLKQPSQQEAKNASSMPSFGSPFQPGSRSESTQATAEQTAAGAASSSAAQVQGTGKSTATDGAPTATPHQETAQQFTDLLKQPAGQEAKSTSSMPSFGSPFQPASRSEQTQGSATQTSLGATAFSTDQAQSAAAQPSFGQAATGAKPEGLPAAAAQTSPGSQQTQPQQVASAPTQLAEQPDDKKFGRVSGEMTGTLSDAQLAAAAGFQGVTGLTSNSLEVKGPEATPQPSVDGEKINAMMNSVTKELGMRDLSQLKLGGEMTLKLDQGALPNTEVKVRFEGNEMVITVDSQTNDVNSFCTDNLALLQQSVSAGMAEDMKVRVEIRNPPTDQPNQRRDDQGGGQGGSGQQGQSGGSSGDQGQPERDDQEGARSL